MIRLLIDLYIFLIVVDVILSYFRQFRFHPLVLKLRKVTGVFQEPIRRYLSMDLPFDPSPIIVILLLNLLKALW